MEFQTTKLANGLEIVAECNDRAYTTAVGFFVRTGARDETDEISGVSHFLEHMVFKGTANRTAERVNLEFDEIGADYNAYTSEESTVYHANVLPEYLDHTVELLADILRPALRKEDFDSEKKVIIEEIMMYEDQPPFGADDKCRATFFGKHPLGRSVLGTVDTVGGLDIEQMRGYWEKRYSPGNITLVVAGKVDFKQLVETAEKVCGSWQPQESPRTKPATDNQDAFQLMHKESATQEYIIHMVGAPNSLDKLRYAAKGVSTVIGDDTGSRLFWELVDQGLAEHASMHYYGYEDAGMFVSYVCCEPSMVEENLAKIRAIYEKAQKQGVTDEEMRQAKSKIASRVVLGSERPRGRLFVVGGNWQLRREYRSVQDDLNTIKSITRDDCQKVLDQYPLNRGTVYTVGPLEKLENVWGK